ncbi:MAG: serine hydrolase [Treponemataceae bacterium]|nr:serine hydrolase [Treponemataceae bacterium]
MKKRFKHLFSLIAVILLSATFTAYAADNNDLAQKYGLKDYSIVYFENGQITYENFGKEIDENSVFELGSNGKTVTAYIALKIVQEGKIGLDDSIAKYLDSNLITKDERIKEITLRQLLCHTGGFSPSYELGVDKKLYSNPGEEFRYSGVGYIYLQNVIENISGMSHENAANYYVFEPLGMSNSTFEYKKTVTPYIRLSSSVLYSFAGFILAFIILFVILVVVGAISRFKLFKMKTAYFVAYIAAGLLNSLFMLFVLVSKVAFIFWIYFVVVGTIMVFVRKKRGLYFSCMPVLTILVLVLGFTVPVCAPATNDIVPRKANSAYTLRSTAKDMSLFCSELMKQYNDGDDSLKDMFLSAVNIDDKNSWGLGIAIESESRGETYWHSGINPGFQSLYVLYPADNKYVVSITNSDNGLDFSKEIAKDFLSVNGVWDIKR